MVRDCAQKTRSRFFWQNALAHCVSTVCVQCVCNVCVMQEFIMCRHSNRGGHYMSEIWEENNSFLKDIKADEWMKRQLRTRAREHTTNALIVSFSHVQCYKHLFTYRHILANILFKPSTSSPNDCFHLQASSSTSPFNSTNLNANRQLLIR